MGFTNPLFSFSPSAASGRAGLARAPAAGSARMNAMMQSHPSLEYPPGVQQLVNVETAASVVPQVAAHNNSAVCTVGGVLEAEPTAFLSIF